MSSRQLPTVAVDVVIFSIDEGQLKALLVQVKKGPFAGQWAFPGGLVPPGESLETTARRELAEKTGIHAAILPNLRPSRRIAAKGRASHGAAGWRPHWDVYLEQLYTFGEPDRDPSGHVVSVTYIALVPWPMRPATDDPKYARVEWRAVRKLPRLAYGHNALADYALARLQAKIGYSNIAYGLLAREFTLAELQEVYEAILGRRLDRRNFRKRVLQLGLVRGLSKQRRGPGRPASLYAFAKRSPMLLD